MALVAIDYQGGRLRVLNQLLLPHTSEYDEVNTVEDAWKCIREMKVRGAPAIAIVAALGLGIELQRRSFADAAELVAFVSKSADYLRTSRPTAVNLFETMNTINRITATLSAQNATVVDIIAALLTEIESMLAKDVADNKATGDYGAEAILQGVSTGEKVRLLTHCNTGSLASGGYGTALGVIRSLWAQGRLEHVYFTETRPYNQGARLTAFELLFEQIPCTMIADSMAAILMQRKGISAVVVGADRVVANGDTANKVGTYMLAICARHHGVPFYVAAPSTSIDLKRASGDSITIEERPEIELLVTNGVRGTPEGLHAWNPAFDVTPSALISGIVTERGVARPAASGGYDMAAFLGAKTS